MQYETFHPVAWLVWLAAASLSPLTTRNPLYLTLTLLAAAVNFIALGENSSTARGWSALVKLGALLWLFTIPFTALTNHYGDIVLFTLPRSWPIIGGPITLESMLYGLTGGLALIGLLLIFATFNLAVDQARLLRMAPGFVYQAGVVAAIAVAFVPQMAASWEGIRDAQQVRGHRFRGVRDLLPLVMPLLVTGLENAMQLAESMEARGFGGTVAATTSQRIAGQAAILGGLAALGVGLAGWGFWPQQRALAGILVFTGLVLLVASFRMQGQRISRSSYRRWVWDRLDRLVLVVSLTSLLIWLAVWALQGDWLFYYPYPPYSPWPTFHVIPGMALLLLAAPGVLLQRRREEMGTVDSS